MLLIDNINLLLRQKQFTIQYRESAWSLTWILTHQLFDNIRLGKQIKLNARSNRKKIVFNYLSFPFLHIIRQDTLLQAVYLNTPLHVGTKGLEQLKEYYPQAAPVTLQLKQKLNAD